MISTSDLHQLCRRNDSEGAKSCREEIHKWYGDRLWLKLNELDAAGDTPIMVAVKHASFDVIKTMLDGYLEDFIFVDIEGKDAHGISLSDAVGMHVHVSEEKKCEIRDYLELKSGSMKRSRESYFVFCSRDDRCQRFHHLTRLVEMGVDINCFEGEGLRNAINWHKSRSYNMLLERPEINPSLCSRDGQTALHQAAISGAGCSVFSLEQDCALIRKLLARNDLDVNCKTNAGITPLMVAVRYGHVCDIEKLIKHPKINIFMKDKQDRDLEDMIGVDCASDRSLSDEKKDEVLSIILTGKEERTIIIEEIGKLESEKESLNKRIGEVEEELRELRLLDQTTNQIETNDNENNVNIGLLEFLNSEIDLKETDLECPVCLEVSEEPIFQCFSGHLICSNCSKRVDICPQCRVRYDPVPSHHRYADKISQDLKRLIEKRSEVLMNT